MSAKVAAGGMQMKDMAEMHSLRAETEPTAAVAVVVVPKCFTVQPV
jgi:hypothetical protein